MIATVPMVMSYLLKTRKQMIYLADDHEQMILGNYFILTMAAALNGFFIVPLEMVKYSVGYFQTAPNCVILLLSS